MHSTYNILIAFFVVLLIILILYYNIDDYLYGLIYNVENFKSRDEKINTIHGWFKANPNPKYVKYMDEVPDSDIVEYEKMRKMFAGGKRDQTPEFLI